LSIEYQTPLGPIRAVDRVSFELNQGEFLGLAGESGCGKSTLAYALMRLLPSTGRISTGEVMLNGKNLVAFSEKKMQRTRGKEIALIFQQSMNSFNPVVNIRKQIVESIRIHEKNVSP